MTLPMRVLARESDPAELRGHTRDISYRGLYFLADSHFEIGLEIDFILTLPQRLPQSGEVDIHCRGQIVRVESADDGRVGVAARIDRYEFQPIVAASAA